MSKNRNRAKFNKANNSNNYRILMLSFVYPAYWDDGIQFYPTKYREPKRRIMNYQVRMYKTWKHNRRTQWK